MSADKAEPVAKRSASVVQEISFFMEVHPGDWEFACEAQEIDRTKIARDGSDWAKRTQRGFVRYVDTHITDAPQPPELRACLEQFC